MGLFSVADASIAALSGMPVSGTRSRSGALHRTGAPVLRGSREQGTFEDTFFAIPAKGETDRLLAAAKRALDEGRKLRREERAGTRALSVAERLLTLLRDQLNLRMQKATGQLGQSHLLKQAKRDIARVKTVLNQKGGK